MIEPAFLFIAVVAGIILVIALRAIYGSGDSPARRSRSSLSRHFPPHSANAASPPTSFDSDPGNPLHPMMAVQLMNESTSHDTRHFEPTHHHAHDASSVPDFSHSHSHDSGSSFDSSSSSFDSSSSSSDSGGSSSCDSSSSSDS
ncbi:MAG: hypothetical protein JWO82_2080 [Akkermansiaceae bacterium]|nr:hypothetical protein [Akkermansiaceae bacterium]